MANLQERVQTGYPERIRSLEVRVMEMEAVLKGIADEIGDLRALLQTCVSRENEQAPRLLAGDPLGGPRLPSAEGEHAGEEVAEAEMMALIMQPDGTLKQERRYKSDYVITR
ncbi:MAG: hypothetical protein QMD46_10060 [Methanomicrobiales archaeon]|nr:hypothetical protein [Methanomicrobiales archaeon]MDI6876754.1 hypothetical protein [Methanomicrobiales archaeon]